ncbi:OmpP1/FadL family transporter [Melioribacteraceae bacterium 4301-Me]|uniref:OmpP1/FadL family transporter n=1 Tax=Pyranulibacter aquaticus TaxID=3163344 RepID=UPI0035950DCE
MKKKILPIIFSLTILATSIYAGGFQINEHGARAMAMAGAFTAIANDASAIYFNPAGITQLKGTNFYGGLTLIAPSASFTGPAPSTTKTDMDSQTFTPINFYVTQQIGDNLFVGLSVNNQYGLGTRWPVNWPGKYLAYDTEIKSFFFTPVVAYKFSNQFSLSAGLVIAYGDVKIIQVSNVGAGDFQTELKGNKTSVGFSAGLMYKPSNEFSIGVSYRSSVKWDLEGTAKSTPEGFTHPLLKVFIPYPKGDVTAPLKTPQNITVGLGYMPTDQLTLAADFQYVGWSSYDKLSITFKNYNVSNPLAPGPSTESVDRNYENTFIIRGGAEYNLSDVFALRAGILYDRNPVKTEYVEPTLPDANRIGLNIGFGYKLTNNLSIDVAYMFLSFSDRDVTGSKFGFNGKYTNNAHLVGADLSLAL